MHIMRYTNLRLRLTARYC